MAGKKKIGVTVDKLARMTQDGFTDLRGEMRKGFGSVSEEMGTTREDIRILRNDMEAGFQTVSASMATIIEKLNLIREDVVQTHDLRARVERLEKKVGLAR
jgi:CHAD domain-containing protein